MSEEQNKAVVTRFIDAANAQDVAVLSEILAPELEARWRQSVLPWLNNTLGGHVMTVKSMMADGDHVVVRIATSGLHTREWHGIPATNKPWANEGVYFIRIIDGRIIELESIFNELPNIKQLGARIVPGDSPDQAS